MDSTITRCRRTHLSSSQKCRTQTTPPNMVSPPQAAFTRFNLNRLFPPHHQPLHLLYIPMQHALTPPSRPLLHRMLLPFHRLLVRCTRRPLVPLFGLLKLS